MPARIPVDRHRTVVSVLREAASVNGDTEAYVEFAETGRRTITFAEWDRAADGVAGYLAQRGVAKGDVVCLLLPSSIEYAVLYAAALRLGAITSGINPRLGAAEVASIVERAAPALVVVEPGGAESLPGPSTVPVADRAEARGAWSGPPPPAWPELQPEDPVAVVWTSGTTGKPKGAIFDHVNLAAVARGTDVLSQPGDRRLSPLPFAHVGYMTRAWDEIANAVTTIITPTPVAGRRGHPCFGERKGDGSPGCANPMGADAGHDEFDRADLERAASCRHRCGACARVHGCRLAQPPWRPGRGPLHLHRDVSGDRHHTDLERRGGGDHRWAAGCRGRAGHRG